MTDQQWKNTRGAIGDDEKWIRSLPEDVAERIGMGEEWRRIKATGTLWDEQWRATRSLYPTDEKWLATLPEDVAERLGLSREWRRVNDTGKLCRSLEEFAISQGQMVKAVDEAIGVANEALMENMGNEFLRSHRRR